MWDIYARDGPTCRDTLTLSHWLAGNAASFTHQGKPVRGGAFSRSDADCHAPIMSQRFMLVEGHRQALLQETGRWLSFQGDSAVSQAETFSHLKWERCSCFRWRWREFACGWHSST